MTENTLNDLVADYLRTDFDVDITTQAGARTPDGQRTPDFELHHRGKVFYGEGEWLHSYAKGLVQAIDYGDIPGASGYFLLGYPDSAKDWLSKRRISTASPADLLKDLTLEKCLFKVEMKRADVRRVRISDVASWFGSVLSAEPLAPESDEFKSLMYSVVDSLTDYLPSVKGGARLFEHVIATIPQEKAEEETARRGSAYLLLNQLVFHRILSSHTELGYTELDPSLIHSGLDIQSRFDEVMVQDYRAIFKTNVIDLFPQGAIPFIRSLIKLISHLKPEEFTMDLLGSIFHTLIPLPVRQPVAAYYTNEWAARLLVSLAGIRGTDRVADFACGSGSLLVAAYEQKAKVDNRPNDQTRHALYLEKEITGIDIMPFAAHLAVVQLALLNPVRWTNQVQVAVEDSTRYHPGDPIRSLERKAISPQRRLSSYGENPEPVQTVERGAMSADGAGTDFVLTPQDVIVMNPPFTRKQYIKKEYREELSARFPDYAGYINREMGFYGYFVALADRFLVDGGRLALVAPAALLRQESMSGIRRLLRERYQIRNVIMSTFRSAFSEDTQIREMLLVATKGSRRPGDARAAMIRTRLNEENLEWIRKLIDGLETSTEVASAVVKQSAFQADDWLPLVPGATLGEDSLSLPRGAPVRALGQLTEVGLIQGLRMESGSAFANTADTLISAHRDVDGRRSGPTPWWTVVRRTPRNVVAKSSDGTREVSIPRTALAPATRSVSGHQKILVTEAPDYVVVQRFKGDTAFWVTPNPATMLVDRRAHVRSRTGRVVLAGYGNVDLTGAGTSLLAFACDPQLAPTWNCWVVRLPSLEAAKFLTLWWNSSFHLSYLLANRIEIRGSVSKWRKPTLLSAPVLDQGKLRSEDRRALIKTFDSLARREFPSLVVQFQTSAQVRLELDIAVGEALGVPTVELEPLLRDFYVAITEEFARMSSMMKADTSKRKAAR